MQLPTIENYGNYSSDNYGVNSLKVTLGDLILWYSYQTIVAFSCSHGQGYPDYRTLVRRNEWSNTTGKHLNWIDGGNKATRVDSKEFEDRLAGALKNHGVEK